MALEYLDQLWRDRLESMLTVDDYINDLVNLLDYYNILNNTYIIYTSDHGYHIGQWRIGCEKKQMYETDIKVPLYIRGWVNIYVSIFTFIFLSLYKVRY